jgi:hypothetical protein
VEWLLVILASVLGGATAAAGAHWRNRNFVDDDVAPPEVNARRYGFQAAWGAGTTVAASVAVLGLAGVVGFWLKTGAESAGAVGVTVLSGAVLVLLVVPAAIGLAAVAAAGAGLAAFGARLAGASRGVRFVLVSGAVASCYLVMALLGIDAKNILG